MTFADDRLSGMHTIGRFEIEGRVAYGVIRGDEIELVAEEDGSEWKALAQLRDAAMPRPDAEIIPLNQVQMLSPMGPGQRVFAVALNYHTHVGETRNSPPESPIIFYKPPSAFVAPNTSLNPPAGYTSQFDYEGEIGVVIGKRCSQVTEGDALSCVFGITAVMDGTARDRLRVNAGEKVFLDWLGSKAADNSSMVGPHISCGENIQTALRERSIGVKTILNDETVQEGSIADLIFSVEQIIVFLTRFITLLPGDILAIGTPGGIGLARGRLLQKGDQLKVQVSHVSALGAAVG